MCYATKTENHINYHQKEFILNDDDSNHKTIRTKYDLQFDGWYANANFLRLSTYFCFFSVFPFLRFGDDPILNFA